MVRLLLAASFAVGCGTEATPAATSSAVPASNVAAAEAPAPAAAPAAEPADAPECTGSGECTWRRFPVVTTEADCACPGCGGGEAVSISRLSELHGRYEDVCGAWLRAHDCPPLVCAESTERSLCIRGRCLGEPVVGEDHTGPLPCAHPGDCPGRAACVTAALGGERGCTDETCCGAAECSNGCATDADCPSCRPLCREHRCRSLTGAP